MADDKPNGESWGAILKRAQALAEKSASVGPGPEADELRKRSSVVIEGILTRVRLRLDEVRASTPHEILGVERGADVDQVRAAWSSYVKKWHPDRFGQFRNPNIKSATNQLIIHGQRAFATLMKAATGRQTPHPRATDDSSGPTGPIV